MPGRRVRRGGEEVRLPDLSFDVLAKLLEAAPETVSLDEFRRDVWGADHVTSETIAQRIKLLRKALGDRRDQPEYIRTVRGAGYAIVGDVEKVEAGYRQHWRRPLSVAAIVAVLTVASLVVGLAFNDGSEGETASPDIAAAEKSTTAILVERAREQLRLHQLRETNRAIALLREALSQEPDHFDARMALASALTTKTTKFGGNSAEEQEAEALARQLIGEQPSNSRAWSLLAYTLGSQGRMDESSSAYEYAYQLDPGNAMAMSSAAHNLLIQGELQQAYVLEMRAKQAGGTNKYAEIQIAQILELIDHPDAKVWREKALQLNPNQTVVLSEIARSHLRRAKPDDALEILSRAEGADQRAPQILQLRGRAALALGQLETAQTLFEAAGDWGHKDLIALNASLGDDGAGAAFLAANSPANLASDTWPGSHVSMAEIAAATGDDESALAFLTQAVNLGWRDIDWLMQSPFLSDLMTTQGANLLVERINRELSMQRRLMQRLLETS
ncbi:MAG: winged helix-turn-helix domain-containing protein [Kordiimonadaceae bacterium]|nr:winged helix-turn-helix domain-containing protein [Kordiimonadaceae bacterium]